MIRQTDCFLLLLAVAIPVSAQEVDESTRTLIHGFDVTDHRSPESWVDLKSKDEFLLPVSEGGPWTCRVDSAKAYSQWRVIFLPRAKEFYVVDTKSKSGLSYGPIPGDPIEKLRLLEFVSDLNGFPDDEQHQRRTREEIGVRVERLLESEDKLTLRHGLVAVLVLGELKQHSLPKWKRLVESASKKRAARIHLQREVRAAREYLASQRASIDNMKVKISDDEYTRSRKPTADEQKLVWGEPTGGLSLAVSSWKEPLRKFDIGNTAKVTYLVRNVSETPKRISTLNVLDGVSAKVIDPKSKHHALLTFGSLSGLPTTERYLIASGELVEVKQFSFRIREGDLHPPGKPFKSNNPKFMYGHVMLRPGMQYDIHFYLNLPSAYNEHEGKITLPAKGEFEGKLHAKLQIGLLVDKAKDKKDKTPKLGRVRVWKGRLVHAENGEPIPNAKILTNLAAAGQVSGKQAEVFTDGKGIFQIPIRDGAATTILPTRWFQAGWQFLGDGFYKNLSSEFRGKMPAPNPNQIVDFKVWPGKVIGGQLLFPDGSPAAGVNLTVGAYINSDTWMKRLGFRTSRIRLSFDHGEWPNWSRTVKTDSEGKFITCVPPDDAVMWTRVGTTSLSFFSIKPLAKGADQPVEKLRQCLPFETPDYQSGKIVPTLPIPDLGDSDIHNLGTLRLKQGTIVQGRVIDTNGTPLANVSLTTPGARGPHSGRGAETDTDGRFEFWAVEPGPLIIRVDARLRDGNGKVVSRDVQAVFVDKTYEIPKKDETPHEIEIAAVPHTNVEFEWVDRRSKPEQPIAYYGCFTLSGKYQGVIRWRGETVQFERDGKKLLVIRTPNELANPILRLTQGKFTAASYEDETGRKSGPGNVDIGEFRKPIKRTIFGDDPNND